MTISNYHQAFKSAIARIYQGSTVVGAGFLVIDRYILTCAHVVTVALGLPQNTQEMPPGTIALDFPLVAPGQQVTAKVVFWQPVKPDQLGEDIAGLELEGNLPGAIMPVRLLDTENYWGHAFRVFGFPKGHNEGVWATGVLRDRRANGWVQLEAIQVPGYQVEPGFSGAPVWDESLDAVVGMAIAAEKRRENVKAAFMMPTTLLASTWQNLNQWLVPNQDQSPVPSSEQESQMPPSGESRVQQTTTRTLQQRLNSLTEDYDAIAEQLNYTSNAADCKRLERQLEALQREMQAVEDKLTMSTQKSQAVDATLSKHAQSPSQIDRKALREALISAFPDETDLDMMLLDEMDVRLNTVAGGKNYKETVFNLVKWAESQGLVENLIKAGRQANPGNPDLRKLAEALE